MRLSSHKKLAKARELEAAGRPGLNMELETVYQPPMGQRYMPVSVEAQHA
jgi:hypothetical protein